MAKRMRGVTDNARATGRNRDDERLIDRTQLPSSEATTVIRNQVTK